MLHILVTDIFAALSVGLDFGLITQWVSFVTHCEVDIPLCFIFFLCLSVSMSLCLSVYASLSVSVPPRPSRQSAPQQAAVGLLQEHRLHGPRLPDRSTQQPSGRR